MTDLEPGDNFADRSLPSKKRRRLPHPLWWLGLPALWGAMSLFQLNQEAEAAVLLLYGFASHILTAAFAILIAKVALVPLIGPFLAHLLSLPVVFVINGSAFILSLFGISKGQTKRVFEAKMTALILVIGVIIGFLLGKLL